jgi:nicotinate phosphoribosyltransferase
MNAVMATHPSLKVKYKFTDRNGTIYPKGFAHELSFEVTKMSELCLKDSEAEYLETLDLFPPHFIEVLKSYRFDPKELKITQDPEGHLEIGIEGFWWKTILWEVPLMALISELYFIETNQEVDIHGFAGKDIDKAVLMSKHGAHFADFGTRRRYSFANQERIVDLFKSMGYKEFVGTSNVHLAMTNRVKPIGTMAHEWIMVYAALYGYKMSNKLALDGWADVYDGDLGIALSDTFTTGVFFKTFTKKLAKLFDGVRHDSGDAFEFTDKVIAHYKSLGIDPMSKVIVFSDGLNPQLAVEIKEYCVGKIKSSFGIGTNFSNDVGVKPLNIVIKVSDVLIEDDWYPCVKLSDNPGKHTGDRNEIKLCKGILRI